jgi:hypothetical protein
MKKRTLLGNILLLIFISCVPQKRTIQFYTTQNLSLPAITSLNTSIYLCMQYTLLIPKKHSFESYKKGKEEVCSCQKTSTDLLEWRIKTTYSIGESYGENTLIIWDKDFVSKYILPLFNNDEYSKKIIEYTLTHSNDNTFTSENVIDYKNKIIINDKVYYYPFKIKRAISVIVVDYEWFKSIIPQSAWIYESSCFDDGVGMRISLLIPLLEEEQ